MHPLNPLPDMIQAVPAHRVFAGQFLAGPGTVTRVQCEGAGDVDVILSFAGLTLRYGWHELILVDLSRSLSMPHIGSR